ncbi:hypothetical protein NL351_29250, partial [Klebsiella pneumoniae]|nr:hypothetical protein [Klebsiella pneumoniae]
MPDVGAGVVPAPSSLTSVSERPRISSLVPSAKDVSSSIGGGSVSEADDEAERIEGDQYDTYLTSKTMLSREM